MDYRVDTFKVGDILEPTERLLKVNDNEFLAKEEVFKVVKVYDSMSTAAPSKTSIDFAGVHPGRTGWLNSEQWWKLTKIEHFDEGLFQV